MRTRLSVALHTSCLSFAKLNSSLIAFTEKVFVNRKFVRKIIFLVFIKHSSSAMWTQCGHTMWTHNMDTQCGHTMWTKCGHKMWTHNMNTQCGQNVDPQCGQKM